MCFDRRACAPQPVQRVSAGERIPLDLCVSHADLRCPLWVSHRTAAGVLRVSVRPVLLFLDLAVLSGERTFAGGALWRAAPSGSAACTAVCGDVSDGGRVQSDHDGPLCGTVRTGCVRRSGDDRSAAGIDGANRGTMVRCAKHPAVGFCCCSRFCRRSVCMWGPSCCSCA